MKNIILFFVCLFSTSMMAQNSINLTPRAKSVTMNDGKVALPQNMTVSYGNLPDEMAVEAARFASDIKATTGILVMATNASGGFVRMMFDTTKGEEGYALNITSEGIEVKAKTSKGFFYAFQTIKKMLPANVMAHKYDARQTYSLPCVSIEDEPRFGYRGFMLDVSRHFFTVEELKRMIDVMAAYKMNVFHWHLTDDQGWRAEIKKYPRLTTVGATAPNCRITDMKRGTYWTNQPYGPYFYTQDDMREIVKYCADRHIDVLPEVDMPGHFVAALAAYPEFSCWPNNPPTVWVNGGVSTNVMNVSDPKAIRFVQNIIDELADIFPYPFFHIGGDECPTSAWEENAACQTLYKQLGLTSYRQLQSRFINQISKYLQSKGKRTVVWNESVTAKDADLNLVKEYNPVVMSWHPCQAGAAKGAELGLQTIITEYHSSTDGLGGGYYINRRQSNSPKEPDGAGYGDDTVEGCYAYVPVPNSVEDAKKAQYIGVQATFWCEWVANREYLEYLALPRLMAVAEAGWTQQQDKNFEDFKSRMAQDTVMLNMGGYEYGRHMWRDALADMPRPVLGKWYRIQTMANDTRANTCFELLTAQSPMVEKYGDKGAKENVLWNGRTVIAGDKAYDYQMWCLEDSPEFPSKYALVCKAFPDGSLVPVPNEQGVGGRFTYDKSKKHYAFILGDGGFGETKSGSNYYTIRPTQTVNWYLNSSMERQGFAVNLWNSPNDGKGGMWEFVAP